MKEQLFKLFSTANSKVLANEIAKALDHEQGNLHHEKFADGEVFVRFEESIRGQTIFVVAQADMPYENLFEMFLTVDAAKRASAKEIICIIPYLPHSRQERKDADRTSIGARVIADFLESVGASRVMTIDLHSNSIEGFFKIPVDHLDSSMLFAKHIKSQNFSDLCLCSPDFGGLKRVKKYKNLLDCDLAVIHKERLKANHVGSMEIIGDVHDKNVIIIDDIIDTAGTLCKAAQLLIDEGAKSVSAYCTHALLSGDAREKIEASPLLKVYVTDSIAKSKSQGKVEVVSSGPLLAKAIELLIGNKSIKELNEKI